MLERTTSNCPIYANHLEWRGDDRWRLTLPACAQRLRRSVGQLQVQLRRGPPRELRIVVGDGRSDFCMAGRADLVLAKAPCSTHCSQAGLPHIAFENFGEATRAAGGLARRRGTRRARPRRQRSGRD